MKSYNIQKTNTENNIVVLILFLLCLTNILNLFVPRFASDESYMLRLPVQLISGIVSVLMIGYSYGYVKKYLKNLLVSINLFCALIVVYLIYYLIFGSIINEIAIQNLRLISWLSAILFFSKICSKPNTKYTKYIKVFIITFLLASSKKILETAKFDSELSGGDIAGLTLILAIPAVLIYFKGFYRILLTTIVIFLVFSTIRRTAILSLLLSSPFLFREFNTRLNKKHMFLFLLFLLITSFMSWAFFGDAVVQRFESLFNGDSGYQDDSYGSGRNIFYSLVLNEYLNSDTLNFIFGNGLNAVSELLRNKYYDIGHVHNDVLEIAYTFGLIGLSIWFFIMAQFLKMRNFVLINAKEYINIYYIFLVSFLVVSLTSGSLFKIEMLIFSLVIGKLIAVTGNRAKGLEVKKRQFIKESLSAKSINMFKY